MLDKRRILELYLNLVELGPGVYGIQDASENYFGKLPDELSADEAAQLAALLPAPRRGMDALLAEALPALAARMPSEHVIMPRAAGARAGQALAPLSAALRTIALFVLAAVAEIARLLLCRTCGCATGARRSCSRRRRSRSPPSPGSCRCSRSAAGRTYAAYAGVYVARRASSGSGLVESQRPDRWDVATAPPSPSPACRIIAFAPHRR